MAAISLRCATKGQRDVLKQSKHVRQRAAAPRHKLRTSVGVRSSDAEKLRPWWIDSLLSAVDHTAACSTSPVKPPMRMDVPGPTCSP